MAGMNVSKKRIAFGLSIFKQGLQPKRRDTIRLLMFILSTLFFITDATAERARFIEDRVWQDSSGYDSKSDFSLSAFPIVFFLPETGLAFGGAGISVFNIGKNKAWRNSSVQLGLAYTLKRQFLLFIPYELYFGDDWRLQGELGYYRYFYNYYGIGIDSKIEDLEFYDADFPRIIASLTRRIDEVYFVGLQYRLDNFAISDQSELLTSQNPVGFGGGTVSTIGLTASYDTRDDIFYPSKGWNILFLNENSAAACGSSFNFSTFSVDASLFFSVAKNHILAFNYYTGLTLGESPYFSYFFMSSGKKGRGFNDRRFIDRNINIGQLEYRYPIYKRFSGVAFMSIGTVGGTYADAFTNSGKFAYGAGLRFQLSKKQKSNIRVDVANSQEGMQFYLTIGEAF